jgi:hypothetical protein
MNTPPTKPSSRQALLAEFSCITTMQRGTLAEEHRQRPAPDGKGTLRLGPYFKHQSWEGGRNVSRRVPADEVAQLREDLANGQRFDALADELAAVNIAHTRALRAGQHDEAAHQQSGASKKNSGRSALKKGTVKVKASSPKPRRGLPRKA